MPQLALLGGIEASGTAMAHFFHPSAKIRKKWPQNDKKRHLFGVLVTGKGIRWVQHKDQMCYLVRIPGIDNSTIFHIVKKNFKILGAPAIPFDSERPAAMRLDPVLVPVPGAAVNPDRIADRNVVPNIEGYLVFDLLQGDIEERGGKASRSTTTTSHCRRTPPPPKMRHSKSTRQGRGRCQGLVAEGATALRIPKASS
jgi:hypothetical protein